MLAKIAVTLAAGVGLGVLAGDAMGASLTVSVTPSTVHPRTRYTITVSGTFGVQSRHAVKASGAYDVPLRHTVFLLAFIQYGGQACKSTATAEYRLPSSEWDWVFFPQRGETRSPFRVVTGWTAGSRLGSRRVCAYMYTEPVRPTTTARPIARASASYSNTKR